MFCSDAAFECAVYDFFVYFKSADFTAQIATDLERCNAMMERQLRVDEVGLRFLDIELERTNSAIKEADKRLAELNRPLKGCGWLRLIA